MTALRILLVDDHAGYLDAISMLLDTEDGLEIVGRGGTGAEGVRLAQDTAPDLVLMDIQMPEMDGIEATRRIKRLPSPPRVLIVSFNDHDAYRDEANGAGADGFFCKSAFASDVLPLIEKMAHPRLAQ